MKTTYAVTWEDSDGSSYAGRLELGASALRFEANDVVREVPYRDISEVRIGESRTGLVLERRAGGVIRIAGVAQPAIVSELAERLSGLVLAQRKTSRVVVVLPIKETAHEQVRDLVAKGPPFDLEASGLDGHHAFLTGNEVIFIFEASDPSGLRRLVANLDLMAAAEAWQQHAAGPARIAEEAFSWSRPDLAQGLSFAATPGPGDSEGGDLYPP
jgi:hypothetical protein